MNIRLDIAKKDYIWKIWEWKLHKTEKRLKNEQHIGELQKNFRWHNIWYYMCSLQNSWWNLISIVVVLIGTFWEDIRSWGVLPCEWDYSIYKRAFTQSFGPFCPLPSTMWEHSKKPPSWKWRATLTRHQGQCLDLGLPSLQNCTKQISIISKLHSLWYFVIEAEMDQDNWNTQKR